MNHSYGSGVMPAQHAVLGEPTSIVVGSLRFLKRFSEIFSPYFYWYFGNLPKIFQKTDRQQLTASAK